LGEAKFVLETHSLILGAVGQRLPVGFAKIAYAFGVSQKEALTAR